MRYYCPHCLGMVVPDVAWVAADDPDAFPVKMHYWTCLKCWKKSPKRRNQEAAYNAWHKGEAA